jgi:hypothetical protein
VKSKPLGKSTSPPDVEVEQVSAQGIWLWVLGKEYFLAYENYPWFKDARLAEILNVSLFHGEHVHWPELDIDIELESLAHPERYPLTYR